MTLQLKPNYNVISTLSRRILCGMPRYVLLYHFSNLPLLRVEVVGSVAYILHETEG